MPDSAASGPLKYPDWWERQWRTLVPFPRTKLRRFIVDQLNSRELTPTENWGPDPRRSRMAETVCSNISEKFDWPMGRFRPEDPLRLLYWETPGDATEITEFVQAMEEEVLQSLPASAFESTIGKLVDTCLEVAPDWPLQPWLPPSEREKPSEICPTFSVFKDVQRFALTRYMAGNRRFRPRSPLREIKVSRDQLDCDLFNLFVKRRYGADWVLRKRFLGWFPPGWSWAVLSLIPCGYLLRSYLEPGQQWISSGGLVGGMLILSLLMGLPVGRFSYPRWRKGLHTFRDLVEFVLPNQRNQ